jgi:hypothetical protein
MLSNVLKCSGDEIYCWILSDLILVNIFNRTIPDSLESIIEMRKESIIEQYLNDYNPMGNFGDLY